MRTAAFLLLVAVAIAAAIGANFVLLGYGGTTDDPVGRLTPRLADVTVGGGGAVTPTVPSNVDDDHMDRDEDEDD